MNPSILDLNGPVQYADFGGSGPPMVLVHGLGGSIANWMAVAGAFRERFRVLALDLVGFGRTPSAGRSATIAANAALLGRFMERVAGAPAVVAGNSMGGLISLSLAADRPDLFSRLILVNPVLPLPPATWPDPQVMTMFVVYMLPLVADLFLRWHRERTTAEQATRGLLRLCGVDPEKLAPEILAAHVAASTARRGAPAADQAYLAAARSIVFTAARRRRFVETIRAVRAPTLLVHGTRDRLVPFAAAEHAARLRPDWAFEVLDGVGHVPPLEVPERFTEVVRGWLDSDRPDGREAAPGLAS